MFTRDAFLTGYMDKTAMIPPEAVWGTALASLPLPPAYIAGHMMGSLDTPAPGEMKKMQADYVKMKLDQALEELEQTKKLKMIKERLGNEGARSLRL